MVACFGMPLVPFVLSSAALAMLLPSAAQAEGGAPIVLVGHTIDGGGGTSIGGGFVLIGTVGQPDAQPMPGTGAGYRLVGGFLSGGGGGGATPCPADLDGSGDVGFADVLAVLSAWGPCGGNCPADLDGSGDVGFADVLAVLSSWGACG